MYNKSKSETTRSSVTMLVCPSATTAFRSWCTTRTWRGRPTWRRCFLSVRTMTLSCSTCLSCAVSMQARGSWRWGGVTGLWGGVVEVTEGEEGWLWVGRGYRWGVPSSPSWTPLAGRVSPSVSSCPQWVSNLAAPLSRSWTPLAGRRASPTSRGFASATFRSRPWASTQNSSSGRGSSSCLTSRWRWGRTWFIPSRKTTRTSSSTPYCSRHCHNTGWVEKGCNFLIYRCVVAGLARRGYSVMLTLFWKMITLFLHN